VAVIFYFNGSAIIIFSHAYVHESEGRPGRDPGSGWYQRAELMIGEAPEIGLPRAWPCEVSRGAIRLDETELDNVIPIPLAHDGQVQLKLEVIDDNGDDRVIEVSGRRAQLTMLGEAYYVEEFPGMD
jgi:hypothetical protein